MNSCQSAYLQLESWLIAIFCTHACRSVCVCTLNKETIVKRKILLLMRFSCILQYIGKKAIIQLKIIRWIDYRFRLKSSCLIVPFTFSFFSFNGICRLSVSVLPIEQYRFYQIGKEKHGKRGVWTMATTTMRDLFLSMKVFIQLSNVKNIKHTQRTIHLLILYVARILGISSSLSLPPCSPSCDWIYMHAINTIYSGTALWILWTCRLLLLNVGIIILSLAIENLTIY